MPQKDYKKSSRLILDPEELLRCKRSMILRLVGGAGQIKLTKDGNVLLHEMVSPLFMNSKSNTLLLL